MRSRLSRAKAQRPGARDANSARIDILSPTGKPGGVLTQSELEAILASDAPTIAGIDRQVFQDIYDESYASGIAGGLTPEQARQQALSDTHKAVKAAEFERVLDTKFVQNPDGSVSQVDPGERFFGDTENAPAPPRSEIPDGTPGKRSLIESLDKISHEAFDEIVEGVKWLKGKVPLVGTAIGALAALSESAEAWNEGDTEKAVGIWADFGLDEITGAVGFTAGFGATASLLSPLAATGPGALVVGAVSFVVGILTAIGVSETAKAAFDGMIDQLQDWGLLPQDGFLNDLISDFSQGIEDGFSFAAAFMGNLVDLIKAGKLAGTPLVLDLDGDGIELVSLEEATNYWDIDQDGFAEAIGWVKADDGLLAIDANGDGIVTDHSELFGTLTMDGFTDLRMQDSNSDDVIDANDSTFADFLVWRDLNQNGISEEEELFTLSELNITSIDLNATEVNQTIAGHDISHVSTYTVDDGVSGPQVLSIVDVWFQYDDVNTDFVGDYSLDISSLFTVNLRGYGLLPDLYAAASIDNDANDPDSLLSLLTELSGKDLVELFTGSVKNEVREIMFRWAGVDAVDPASRGTYVDARELEFLEELIGQPILQWGWQPNPAIGGAGYFNYAFDLALNAMAARLTAQAAGRDLFMGDVFYDPITDSVEGITGLNSVALNSLVATSLDPLAVPDKTEFWMEVVNAVDQAVGVANLASNDLQLLENALVASDFTLTVQQILDKIEWTLDSNYELTFVSGDVIGGTSGDDILAGSVGDDQISGAGGVDTISGGIGTDILNGQAGNDILDGQLGDDEVYGDSGSDTYLYYAGHGHDTFRENSSGTDKILFGAGIAYSDLTLTRITDDDLLIEIDDSVGGGAITVQLQFRSSNSGYIETLEFADGSTVSLNTVEHTLYGTSGADNLHGIRYGGAPNETIYGMEGDDSIYGYHNAIDTGENFLYGGDGNDQVYGANGIDTIEGNDGNDTLRGYNGNDLIDGGNGDDTIYGGSHDDLLIGGAGADILFGEGNNDILIGGLGADELTGAAGYDTFRFLAGETFDAVDTIKDFHTYYDTIDISDILSGYDSQTSAITDFVQITDSGSDSILAVDADGGGDSFVQIAVILNKTGLTDEDALLSGGQLLAA